MQHCKRLLSHQIRLDARITVVNIVWSDKFCLWIKPRLPPVKLAPQRAPRAQPSDLQNCNTCMLLAKHTRYVRPASGVTRGNWV